MADDVIKEYLVGLGYKIDKAGEQRFVNSLNGVEKTVLALGASLAAAAAAIYATVIKVASGLDDLYFSAQRTNTSVSNVRAYTYALSQLGVSASAAGSTIEGIAKAIRTNPGNESLIRSLGVSTRDANGNLRDTVDILVDLDKTLSKKPQYIAAQYAQALGIDEGTFNQVRGQAAKIQEDMAWHRGQAAKMGVDPDRAAADANKLMTAVRELTAQVDLLVLKVASDLGPPLIGYIREFSDWITAHKDEIVQFVGAISRAFIDLASAVFDLGQKLGPVVQGIGDITKALTGKDVGMEAALAAVLLYATATWLPGMLGVVGALKIAIIGLTAYIAVQLHDALSDKVGGALDELDRRLGISPPPGYDLEGERNMSMWDRFKRFRRVLPTWLGGGGEDYGKVYGSPHDRQRGQSLTTEEQKRNAEESFQFWKSKGLTDEQAAGLVANEIHESRTNPNAVGDGGRARGIFQHHPDRRANIKAGTGIDMADATHRDQLEGAWWELNNTEQKAMAALLASKTAEEAAAAISLYYERPADARGQASARAATAAKYLAERDKSVATVVQPNEAPRPNFNVPGKFNGMGLKSPQFTSPDLSGAGTPLLPWGMPLPGASSIDMKQNTTINVYGSSDPHITAAEVVRKQGTLNGALLNSVKGAVQ